MHCVLALYTRYFPESCEQISRACYSVGVRTHYMYPCNSRAVSYQLDYRDCPAARGQCESDVLAAGTTMIIEMLNLHRDEEIPDCKFNISYKFVLVFALFSPHSPQQINPFLIDFLFHVFGWSCQLYQSCIAPLLVPFASSSISKIYIIIKRETHFIQRHWSTFGNCQRPVFSLGVSQQMHKITNIWSSKLQDNNGRKNTLVTQSCVHSDAWFWDLKI